MANDRSVGKVKCESKVMKREELLEQSEHLWTKKAQSREYKSVTRKSADYNSDVWKWHYGMERECNDWSKENW